MFLYKDGNIVGSDVHSVGGAVSTDGSIDVAIGNQPASAAGGTRAFDGRLDEVRILKVVRSTEWLQTEYTNQLNPLSFYSSIGTTEIVNDDPCDAIELTVEECYTPLVFTNYSATGSGIADPGWDLFWWRCMVQTYCST